MTPASEQETDEAVMVFPQEGTNPAVRDGTASSTAWGASQGRHGRSGVTKRSPGPSGEGLASEPWWVISLPGTSRSKRRRKGSAQGLTQPKSLSVKSPAARRCNIRPKLPRRPPPCQDVGEHEKWVGPKVAAATRSSRQAPSGESDDVIIKTRPLWDRKLRKACVQVIGCGTSTARGTY